jgi:hypothetical protein
MRRVFRAFTVAGVCAMVAQPYAFDQTWSAIGSVGILDPSSAGTVAFSDTGSVFIKSSISSATAHLRYPVTAVGELEKSASETTGGTMFCLRLAVRDTGSGSRVLVSLKSVGLASGQVLTHGTFDTDAAGLASTAYTLVDFCHLGDGHGGPLTDFFSASQSYYVDVVLMKSSSTANPGFKSVAILSNGNL